MNGTSSSKDWFLLSFLLIVWGLNYAAIKVGLEYSAPLAFSFYRMLVGTIASIPLLLRSWKALKKFNRKTLLAALLLAVSASVLFQGFWFLGEALVPAGLTAVVIYTYPLFTVIFTKLFLSDKLTTLKVLGIVAGFAGIFLVLTSGRLNVSVDPYGIVLLLISAISFAASFVVYRRWLTSFDRLALNSVQLFFATSILLVWTLLSNSPSLLETQFTNIDFLGALLFTGVLGTTFAYVIWMTLVNKRGPIWVSTWLFLVPVVALASSVLFLGETIDLIQALGFVIVLAGLGAVSRG